MRRLSGLAAVLGLSLSVMFAPTIWAEDDDKSEQETPEQDDYGEQGRDSTVHGLIYEIWDNAGAKVLTIYDRDVGLGGRGVDVYVRDPALLMLIQNGTACVGRYAVAEGVRTGPGTLDAQGLMVDMAKACGEPPQ